MHIAVIGAGVVGVTTAWALRQRGHRVTVIEAGSAAGLETSRANAGQRSYGYVYPWAAPAMIKKALPWLMQADGPLKMRLPPSPDTVRFLWSTWRYANTPGLCQANKEAMLALGAYSRERFTALEEQCPFDFAGGRGGLIELASNHASYQGLEDNATLLKRLGIAHELLSPDRVYDVEPGLSREGELVGAIRLETDGTGDCHLFTQALAAQCERAGVAVHYNTRVTDVVTDSGRPVALDVQATDEGGQPSRLEADAFVLCAGTASGELARKFGVKLPLYPVKGYSLTAPLTSPADAPVSTVIDDRYKVVATRLDDRIRVTGFVELADYDRAIPERRIATLKKAMALRFPKAADLDRAKAWAGFRPMTPDGPPALGRGPADNVYLNTGHGTFGWTLSAGSADCVAQLIDGETPAVDLDAFRPDRF